MRGRWVSVIGASGDDSNVVELRAKIRALVQRSFGGSFRALYDHYDPSGAGADRAALTSLLADADVGNVFTRGLWADGVMTRVDTNHDGRISWDEFAQIVGLPEASSTPIESGPVPAPVPAQRASAPRTPKADEDLVTEEVPVLDKRQALGLIGGLFGFATLLAAIRAIGER